MTSVNRRSFLKGSVTTAISAPPLFAASPQGVSIPPVAGSEGIIDTQVYLSHWPARRMDGDATAGLVEILRKHKVAQAWTSSFDALLHKDMGALNARVARECRQRGAGILTPFGAINPKLPDWEEDLRRCHEEFRMPGIRLHPNYHHYTLADPAFLRLLQLASGRGLLVQIAAWMEDERCPNPLLLVPTVDLSPLPGLLEKVPAAKVMILNAFLNMRGAREFPLLLEKVPQVSFEFARLEGLTVLQYFTAAAGAERVIFSSYSPMFYFESALLKVREAALPQSQASALFSGNARRLIARA